MKLYCKKCKRTLDRDMRTSLNKELMTKRGFESYCEKAESNSFLVPYDKKKHKLKQNGQQT